MYCNIHVLYCTPKESPIQQRRHVVLVPIGTFIVLPPPSCTKEHNPLVYPREEFCNQYCIRIPTHLASRNAECSVVHPQKCLIGSNNISF